MEPIMEQVNTEAEIRLLAQTADEIWHEYFPCILSAEQIDYMVEKIQSPPALTQQLRQENYRYYLLRSGEEIAGYMGCKSEGNKMFLSKLYVKQKYRGKGLGGFMLRFLFALARKEGAGSVYLTVNRFNEHTIAVYKKTGFVIAKKQVSPIGNGYVMDDYIMECTL